MYQLGHSRDPDQGNGGYIPMACTSTENHLTLNVKKTFMVSMWYLFKKVSMCFSIREKS